MFRQAIEKLESSGQEAMRVLIPHANNDSEDELKTWVVFKIDGQYYAYCEDVTEILGSGGGGTVLLAYELENNELKKIDEAEAEADKIEKDELNKTQVVHRRYVVKLFSSNVPVFKYVEEEAEIARHYYEVKKPITFREECHLICVNSLPAKETLQELAIEANEAYVRYQDQLFYINKRKNLCDQIIIAKNKLEAFDNEMQPTDKAQTLSKAQLTRITEITRHTAGYIILLMEYIPGRNLNTELRDEKSQLHTASFEQRIHLSCSLLHWYNLFHHQTPSTGQAIVHADTKEENTHVFYNPETKQFEAYVFDFGLSLPLKDEMAYQQVHSPRSTWYLFPPEMVLEQKIFKNKNVLGTKSDLIGYLLLRIFGGKDRYYQLFSNDSENGQMAESQRIALRKKNAHIPYDTNGMFAEIIVPRCYLENLNISFDLKGVVENYIKRMLSLNCMRRPTTDESLNFFTTVLNLCQLLKKQNSENEEENLADEERKLAYVAKLCILEKGLWSAPIGTKPVMNIDSFKKAIGIEEMPLTFADYAFQLEPEINKDIVLTYISQPSLGEKSKVVETIKQKNNMNYATLLASCKNATQNLIKADLQLTAFDSKASSIKDKLLNTFAEESKELQDDQMQMLINISLIGMLRYKERDGSHLRFFQKIVDGDRGKTRVNHYGILLHDKNNEYSPFAKLIILHALLGSLDGKQLQKDIVHEFNLIMDAQYFTADSLRQKIAGVIKQMAPSKVQEIDRCSQAIVKALNNKKMPEKNVLDQLKILGMNTPAPSLYQQQRSPGSSRTKTI